MPSDEEDFEIRPDKTLRTKESLVASVKRRLAINPSDPEANLLQTAIKLMEDGTSDESVVDQMKAERERVENPPEAPSRPVMSPVPKRKPDNKKVAQQLRIATEKAMGTGPKPDSKYFVIPEDKS